MTMMTANRGENVSPITDTKCTREPGGSCPASRVRRHARMAAASPASATSSAAAPRAIVRPFSGTPEWCAYPSPQRAWVIETPATCWAVKANGAAEQAEPRQPRGRRERAHAGDTCAAVMSTVIATTKYQYQTTTRTAIER